MSHGYNSAMPDAYFCGCFSQGCVCYSRGNLAQDQSWNVCDCRMEIHTTMLRCGDKMVCKSVPTYDCYAIGTVTEYRSRNIVSLVDDNDM